MLDSYNKIESLIKRAVYGSNNVVYARKCTITEINNDEAKEFEELYHL